jgi:hypothetical protein
LAINVSTYTIGVTVTSAFDVTANTTAVVAVRASGVAPVISLVGEATRDYFIRDGFKITTALVPESVGVGATVG